MIAMKTISHLPLSSQNTPEDFKHEYINSLKDNLEQLKINMSNLELCLCDISQGLYLRFKQQ